MKNSFSKKAITRIQAIIILVVIVVAAAGGTAYYYMTLPPPKPIEITYWTHVSGAWAENIHKLMDEYTISTNNRTVFKLVEGIDPDTGILPKLMGGAAAGELPDIVMFSAYHNPDIVPTGIYLEPPDDIQSYVTDNWLPWAVQSLTWDGKIWGIPEHGSLYALVVNMDLLKKEGFDRPPRDWAELREYAKKLTKYDPDTGKKIQCGFGLMFRSESSENFLYTTTPFIWMKGGDIYDPTTNTMVCNSTQSIEGLQILYDMVVVDDSTNFGFIPLAEGYQSGVVAMCVMGSWFNWWWSDLPELYNNTVIVPIPVPVGYTGNPVTLGYNWALYVTKGSKNPEEAWKFLEWYTSDDRYIHVINAYNCYTSKKSELSQPYIADDVWNRGFKDLLPYARQLIYSPYFSEISIDIYTRSLEDIFTGQKTIKEAMDYAATLGNEKLKE